MTASNDHVGTAIQQRPVYYVKYYPELKTATGSEKTAILIDRLEYWFALKPDGFYKFFEPCDHPCYRKGDSWLEEISLNRRAFTRVFSHVGTRYPSKTAFFATKDKFQGKLYALYYERTRNQTHFLRNHEVANAFITKAFAIDAEENLEPSQEPHFDAGQNIQSPNVSSQSVPFKSGNIVQFRKDENCSKPLEASKQKAYSRKSKAAQKKEPIPDSSKQYSSKPSDASATGEKMKKIWIEEVGELDRCQDKPGLCLQLENALRLSFAGQIERWRRYCRMIASSKFLMGETGNKDFRKAWISWVIKPATVERILAGEFVLGDRSSKLDTAITNQREQLRWLQQDQEGLVSSLDSLKHTLRREQRQAINQRIAEFTQEEEAKLKQSFAEQAQQRSDFVGEEFRKSGWQNAHIPMMYRFERDQKVSEQLFGMTFDDRLAKLYQTDTRALQLTEELKEQEEQIAQAKAELSQLVQEHELTVAMSPVGYGQASSNKELAETDEDCGPTLKSSPEKASDHQVTAMPKSQSTQPAKSLGDSMQAVLAAQKASTNSI
ncbi:MAG: hypothetical protein ABFQ95_05075 [Pseudomonadota bacterium]